MKLRLRRGRPIIIHYNNPSDDWGSGGSELGEEQ